MPNRMNARCHSLVVTFYVVTFHEHFSLVYLLFLRYNSSPDYKRGTLKGRTQSVYAYFPLEAEYSVTEMQSPSLVSLSAVIVAALALLIPASEAVLPLALPALSASAASAIIGLSTLALVKAWMPDF